MLYTYLLKRIFETLYGAPSELGESEVRGLVVVADGVGGLDLCGTALRHEVARAVLPLAVRVVPWGHGLGSWHADLTRVENHVDQAAAIAAEVAEFRERRPGEPIYLVGKSGGTGIVARVLELLPDNAIERAVLIAPALSPEYDLTRAARAVRNEIVVFWSPLDLIVLGLGTRLFGTIDRVHSVSAGLVGFRSPPEKLRQVRWHPEMAATGYLGGHVGPDSPMFLRKYVLPLLDNAVTTDSRDDSSPVSSPPRAAPIT